MANEPDRNDAAVPPDARVPATHLVEEVYEEPPVPLDINGFDPNEFEWRPVPRRARKDGWSHEVQQSFIEALAGCGSVDRACMAVNRSVSSAYNLRNAPDGQGFAKAWDAVLIRAARRLLDVAFEHAIDGEEVPIFDQDGVRTGAVRRYNTRMAMFLLRAYFPERFRHAGKDVRTADEPAPPVEIPTAEVIASLAPVTPEAPHRLSSPERFAVMHDTAHTLASCGEPKEKPERYRPPPVEPDHDKVVYYARRNRARRERREAREDELYPTDMPDE